MPKIIEEFEDEEEPSQFDEDDTEEEFEEPLPPKKVERRGRPRKNPSPIAKRKVPQPPQPQTNPGEVAVKRRYGVVPPQPIRIIDAESNEVFGEGEFAVYQVLSEILERLERIENNIGSMLDG
jgi:hypothetical protein|tara:strand:+ start:888 stop:1256 length:369 start_codon:yes stop_codon:yes gene_type:complete